MRTILSALIFTFTALPATAHNGHDHDSPMAIQAPKGGTIKSLEKTRVEVAYKGQDIKIYLYDTEMKPKTVTGFNLTAQAELPRTKKTDTIPLTAKETWFEGRYDAKGIHRYTLHLDIQDPSTGHHDKLTFTIEPRR